MNTDQIRPKSIWTFFCGTLASALILFKILASRIEGGKRSLSLLIIPKDLNWSSMQIVTSSSACVPMTSVNSNKEKASCSEVST